MGALGAFRFAADHDRVGRRRAQNPAPAWRRETGAERFQTPRLRRAVSAPRQAASLLLQTLCARHITRSQTGSDQARYRNRNEGSRPRRRAVDGDVSEEIAGIQKTQGGTEYGPGTKYPRV